MKIKLILLGLCFLAANAGFADEKKNLAKFLPRQKSAGTGRRKMADQEPDRQGKFVLIDFWPPGAGPVARPSLN